jgi:AcrR family transcriptional regulator
MTASDARALDGRTIGKRGAVTRRRLLDATAALLADRGVLELRVVDIARAVGTSSSTYYQYFRDVDEAVLELADEIGRRDVEPLARVLDEPWNAAQGLERARALVDRFIHVWDDHSAVLRTRNLAAQEGDQRFRETRNRTNRPFLEGFAAQVRAHQAEGRIAPDLSPMAAAAALMALIERMAAFHSDLVSLGVSRDDVVETTARIVFDTVVG